MVTMTNMSWKGKNWLENLFGKDVIVGFLQSMELKQLQVYLLIEKESSADQRRLNEAFNPSNHYPI